MICPVEIAHEMSALRAVRIGDHAEHGNLSEGRGGAGDESTGRDAAGDGEEDYLVASGGDSRHQRPAYAADSDERYRREGYDGLVDRLARPSPHVAGCR